MARNLKNYSEEIKLGIYKKLNERKLRFDDLHEATHRNRVTLSEYLTHSQEIQEVQRDPKTKEYELTAKGKAELDRLLLEKEMEDAPFHYKEIIHPESEIGFQPPMKASERRRELFYNLPLPMGLQVNFYGSERLAFLSEGEEELFRDFKIPEKDIPRAFVSDQLREYAEDILWKFISRRLWMLLEWHEHYTHNIKPPNEDSNKIYRSTELRDFGRKKPPPLTLENILGFDLSVTFRFPGKLLDPPKEGLPTKTWIESKRKIEKLLVGALLLRIASGNTMDCEFGVFEHFEKAGLIKKEDADTIEKLEKASLLPDPSGKKDYFIEDPKKRKIYYQRVYETACRYFAESGIAIKSELG